MGKSFSSAVTIATAEPSSLLNETLTPYFHFLSPEAVNAEYSKNMSVSYFSTKGEENEAYFQGH